MRKNWLALACGVAVMPAMVHAQEAEQESAQERAWDIETEASYLLSRGNSESESIVGKVNAAHDGVNWRQTAKAEAVNTMSDNDDGEEERTAERYYASYKLDRKLTDNNYLFNVLTYDKDNFSGFQYQASYALGLGRRFLETPAHTAGHLQSARRCSQCRRSGCTGLSAPDADAAMHARGRRLF